ncbi:MAG: metal ABC transporter substrate-binding protein [Pseudorhodoplanes sp.]|jgi:zinc/manganese transport system substrate-binding protein|nr:metal ABC transporter substrate-binding protein [Pseudorhodoplanes sp.]
MLVRRIVVAVTLLTSLAAPALAQERLKTVATFSILADFVKKVGGDKVDVVSLVAPDGDAHVYAPTPADAKKLADAQIVFTNGLGFEGWITRLVKSSATKADIVVATRGLKPLKAAGGHGHDHDGDPHAWQSVANAKTYVANIRDALVAKDPANKAVYEANAAAYLGKLDQLDTDVREAIARIPAERRRIITTHDAFGYFRAAYGVDFVAPQGVSTDSEASARDVAKIITQIKKQKIPAVFLENVSDPRLLKRIADETGARLGGTLYSDALTGEKGPAPTYIDMIRHNIRTLSAALMS